MKKFILIAVCLFLGACGVKSSGADGGGNNPPLGVQDPIDFKPQPATPIDTAKLASMKTMFAKMKIKVPTSNVIFPAPKDASPEDVQRRQAELAVLDTDGKLLLKDIQDKCTLANPPATETNPPGNAMPPVGHENTVTQWRAVDGSVCPVLVSELSKSHSIVTESRGTTLENIVLASNVDGNSKTSFEVLDKAYQNKSGLLKMGTDINISGRVYFSAALIIMNMDAKGVLNAEYLNDQGVAQTVNGQIMAQIRNAGMFMSDKGTSETALHWTINWEGADFTFQSHVITKDKQITSEVYYLNGNKVPKEEFEGIANLSSAKNNLLNIKM